MRAGLLPDPSQTDVGLRLFGSYSCTKGHRSSKCTHYDRILYKVRKPGRPLNNCPHVLPDSIPPGTFVNTSAESMANGNPPKEACNCRSDLVQVAIPKGRHSSLVLLSKQGHVCLGRTSLHKVSVTDMMPIAKSCSCLEQESLNAIQPPPPSTPLPMVPEANDTMQNGVKKGRIGKRANSRRKKSTVSEEAIEAAESEAAQAGSEKAGMPNVGGNGVIVLSRTPCTDPGWQGFDVLIGPVATQQGVSVMKRLVSRDDLPADPNQPFGQTVSEANNYWPQRMPGAPLVSPTDGGINHLSLSQNSTQNFPVTNPDYNAAYAQFGGNPQFMDPFPKPSANFFAQTPSPNVTPIPQQSVAPFSPARSRYEQLPNLNLPSHGGGSNGCVKRAAPAPTLANPPPDVRANEETVTVELTQQEWVAVQQARTAGVNFTELAKAISSGQLLFLTLHSQSTTVTEDSNHPSNATSPYTASARSSPPVNNGSGGSGSCSTQIKSPPPPPSTFTSHGCGCGEKQQQRQAREETLVAPNSPRCKCGDSCRCVPCADHPHNPAMLAHIRRNMELMDAPQQGMFDPSLGGGGGGMNSGFSPNRPLAYDGYYDDGDGDAPQDSMNDFNDFVICDYRYGNGTGGCKCGEGCTCIGCLMHGGHDGALLDMKSSGKNHNGGGDDGGGGVRS